MPKYPFIILGILLLTIAVVPPFVAAVIDMRLREEQKNRAREEERHG